MIHLSKITVAKFYKIARFIEDITKNKFGMLLWATVYNAEYAVRIQNFYYEFYRF